MGDSLEYCPELIFLANQQILFSHLTLNSHEIPLQKYIIVVRIYVHSLLCISVKSFFFKKNVWGFRKDRSCPILVLLTLRLSSSHFIIITVQPKILARHSSSMLLVLINTSEGIRVFCSTFICCCHEEIQNCLTVKSILVQTALGLWAKGETSSSLVNLQFLVTSIY